MRSLATMQRWALMIAICHCAFGGSSPARADPSLEPRAEIQRELEEMGRLVRSDPVEFYRRALSMRNHVRGPQELIGQLIYFSSRPDNAGMAIPRQDIAAKAIQLLEIRHSIVVAVAAEYLGDADYNIRDCVRVLVGGTNRREQCAQDFTAMSVCLADHPEMDREPIFVIMLSQNPTQALQIIPAVLRLDHDTTKMLTLADHDISDVHWKHGWGLDTADDRSRAVRQLAELARSDKWWVRRYAAEVAWECKEFGDPGLLNQIKNDANPLVNGVLARPNR